MRSTREAGRRPIGGLVLAVALAGSGPAVLAAPALAPLPDPPRVDAARAELGRLLFFDSRLSGDTNWSLASCHDPAKGWGDGKALADGYTGSLYFRNAPTLFNSWGERYLTRDGRVESGGMVPVDSDIHPVEPLDKPFADIVLPAAGWGEEDFTRCNAERRLRLYSKFYDPPARARPDWWAIAAFGRAMGFDGFDWKSSNDIFQEASRFSRTGVLRQHPLVVRAKAEGKRGHDKLREYGTTGIQTPIRERDGQLVGTARLHDPANDRGDVEGVGFAAEWLHAFDTHDGKALLLETPWTNNSWSDFYEAIKPRPEKGEIWITNGRVNETWQSGFDDRRKPYLAKRWPWPFRFIHPADAAPDRLTAIGAEARRPPAAQT